MYLEPGQVRGPDDVRDTVVRYRLLAHRAELMRRYATATSDGESIPPAELLIAPMLQRQERLLREQVTVVEAHRFQAPYWHLTGMIVQAVLGRSRDGPKEVRLRAFSVEHTIPAYDTRAANLRDRGLRLARSAMRPLARAEVAGEGPFLPWAAVPEATYREIRKWERRDLDPELEPVAKRGGYLFARRILVHRPYWLARILTDAGQSWVLVDGAFGTIGGYPGETEARALLRLGVADPAGRASAETRAVVTASRCPDCGFDQAIDSRHLVSVCANCHLALRPLEAGLQVFAYSHAAEGASDLDATYLPFWYFEFRLELAGGRAATRLEDYAAALFARGRPPGFTASGPHLVVPAFRLLGTEIGDRVFQDLVYWIHGCPLALRTGKVPLGGRASFLGVTVAEADARETGPYLLYGIHGKASAARLNTLLLKKMIDQAPLTLSPARLVYVPFEPVGSDLVGLGSRARLARLLVDGGPELDALRVSVHQPAPKDR
jgi:hypothetical protein